MGPVGERLVDEAERFLRLLEIRSSFILEEGVSSESDESGRRMYPLGGEEARWGRERDERGSFDPMLKAGWKLRQEELR